MRIMLGMHHPKHFWMFRNLILAGQQRGWEFTILVSKKDVLEDLLKWSGFTYYVIGENQPNMARKIAEFFKYVYYTCKYSAKFKPDVYIGQALPHFGFLAALRSASYFIYEDTEYVSILHKLTVPFCTAVVTPKSFKKKLGAKQVHINSNFELAYLHPNNFTPNPQVLEDIGVNYDEKFAVIRFVSWHAYHDIGENGIAIESKINTVKEISKYAKVFITSEGPLPDALAKYRLDISPEKMHHVLHYAHLCYGESPTMTTESVMVGTPAICISSWAHDLGNFGELMQHGLIMCFAPGDEHIALEKAIIWLTDEVTNQKWNERRKEFLNEKMDVAAFMIWLLDRYPESLEELKKSEAL